MKFALECAVRPNILKLQPYRCARDDYSEGILLDANENAFGTAIPDISKELQLLLLERYPDPHQQSLKIIFAKFRNIAPENLFFGVGSDEAIDLIIRVFCQPQQHKILVCPPTYGMYAVCANVNDVGIVKVPLLADFQLDVEKIKSAIDQDVRVLFLCSPGNPTGSLLSKSDIVQLLKFDFNGVIVIDEAYIDFCEGEQAGESPSLSALVKDYPNLIVIQTLSKSFGLAGIRFGISISSPEISQIFNNTKAPYNISTVTSTIAKSAMEPTGVSKMNENVSQIKKERLLFLQRLKTTTQTGKVLGKNDANFVLFEVLDAFGKASNEVALRVYKRLAESLGVVVRFRGMEAGCLGCLRVTIGTEEENGKFFEAFAIAISDN